MVGVVVVVVLNSSLTRWHPHGQFLRYSPSGTEQSDKIKVIPPSMNPNSSISFSQTASMPFAHVGASVGGVAEASPAALLHPHSHELLYPSSESQSDKTKVDGKSLKSSLQTASMPSSHTSLDPTAIVVVAATGSNVVAVVVVKRVAGSEVAHSPQSTGHFN